jgi:hypothetical protein
MTSKPLYLADASVSPRPLARAGRWLAAGAALAATGYAATVALTWLRYGHPRVESRHDVDLLLDRFMPSYDVAERHQVEVEASADVTLTAAAEVDLQASDLVRAIFKAREIVLRADRTHRQRAGGLLAEMKALGWGVLAEVPGREIVMGAVTQPWLPDVVFRSLSPDAFREFSEPGYVKIAWTLRADVLTPAQSMFRTETRVVTTDAASRAKFRWYWARFSPGIIIIRRALLPIVKTDAERRHRLRGLPSDSTR